MRVTTLSSPGLAIVARAVMQIYSRGPVLRPHPARASRRHDRAVGHERRVGNTPSDEADGRQPTAIGRLTLR